MSAGRRLSWARRSRSALAIVVPAALLVSFLMAAAPAGAVATTRNGPQLGSDHGETTSSGANYDVTVYTGTTPYLERPNFLTRVSPPLSTGVTLTGGITCTYAYVTGRPKSIRTQLTAGSYTFDVTLCTSTLGLTPPSAGSITLLGGPYTVVPDSTVVIPAPTYPRVTSATATHPTVTLAAHVVETSITESDVGNLPVVFGIQLTNDIIAPDACTSTTVQHLDGTTGTWTATCTLTGTTAKGFLNGTGLWYATFAGTKDFVSSTIIVQSTGATSPTQAAINEFDMLRTPKNKITVVPDTTPPGCQGATHLVLTTTTTLLGVSVNTVKSTCKAFQVLQILDTVVLGAIPVATAGTGLVAEAVEVVSANAQYAAFQAGMAEYMTTNVVVTAPPEYI